MIRVYTDSHGLFFDHDGVVRRAAEPLTIDGLFTATDPAALARVAWAAGWRRRNPAIPPQ